MNNPTPPTATASLIDQPLVRIIAYYLILGAAILVLHRLAPNIPGLFGPGRFDQVAAGGSVLTGDAGIAGSISPLEAAREAVVAMLCSYLLMLPVAWTYILTRSKRGYQQSLVQTIVILPIVVAGVVILVKSSVALAFSLGGIVGAIAFRNRLEDTKDAVHVFLAIGVGVACGVQVVAVAVVLSMFYNLVNLSLWWTDFGRVPAELGGAPAQRRLDRLRASGGRRNPAFVSQVDSMLLRSMTPEQLEVLASRAEKRRRRLAQDIGLAVTGELKKPKFDTTIRVVTAVADAESVRRDAEKVLGAEAKYWQLEEAGQPDRDRQSIQYRVRCKKSVPAPLLVEAIRRTVAGRATVEHV
ncbi:MAG: DUF4956 domain-containing protein [Gemmatimonadales bacterium]